MADYVASYSTVHGSDLLQFGVKGMKWGVRKADAPTGKRAGRPLKNGSPSEVASFANTAKQVAEKDGLVGANKAGVQLLELNGYNQYKKDKQPPVPLRKIDRDYAERVHHAATHRASKDGRVILSLNDIWALESYGYMEASRGAGKLTVDGKTAPKIDKVNAVRQALNLPVRNQRLRETSTLNKVALGSRIGALGAAGALLLMSDDVKPEDYLGSHKAGNSDLLQFGVKGMKWGVRKGKSHSFEIHQNTAEDGGRDPKKGDVLRNPRSSTGRVQITSLKQTDREVFQAKGVETSKPVTVKVGAVIPTKTVKDNIKNEAKGEVKDRLFDLLMSDDVKPEDYLGSHKAGNSDLLQYGVKGMKWGVRRDRRITARPVKGATPTRARKKEQKDIARSKEIDRLTGLRDRVESGKSTVSRNGKKLSTDQALKAIDADINKLAKGNKVHEKKTNTLVDKGETSSNAKNSLKKDIDGQESTVHRYNRLKAEVAKKGASSLDDDDLKFLNARREAINKANAAYRNKDSKLQKVVQAAIELALTKQLNTGADKLADLHVKPRIDRMIARTVRNPPTPTPTP